MLAQGEGRRREYMKGGEEHMLHIVSSLQKVL
jgi:hypothetical protein